MPRDCRRSNPINSLLTIRFDVIDPIPSIYCKTKINTASTQRREGKNTKCKLYVLLLLLVQRRDAERIEAPNINNKSIHRHRRRLPRRDCAHSKHKVNVLFVFFLFLFFKSFFWFLITNWCSTEKWNRRQ